MCDPSEPQGVVQYSDKLNITIKEVIIGVMELTTKLWWNTQIKAFNWTLNWKPQQLLELVNNHIPVISGGLPPLSFDSSLIDYLFHAS